MTTERWTDERLDQLAQLVESNARQIEANARQIEANSHQIEANARQIEANSRQIEANARQIEANSRLIESNSRTIQALADLAAEERQERAAILESIREIQQEVRGLQTENHRILDILLNERRDEAAD